MLVKSYKRIRGDYADEDEMRKATCCETGRSYAKQDSIWGQMWGQKRRSGHEKGHDVLRDSLTFSDSDEDN